MNLYQACARFLVHCDTDKNLSQKTLAAYRGDLDCFASVIGGDRKLLDFSGDWIETAVKIWHGSLKPTTVKRRVACVKVLVRWLCRRQLIEANPFDRIHIELKIPRRLPRNLQTEEIRKLVATKPESICGAPEAGEQRMLCRADWDKLTARTAIEVLFLTGVRIGELVRINITDVDQELRQILVLGKGNKERQVSFPDVVSMNRLASYRKHASLRFGTSVGNGFFLNGLGRPANDQYMRRVIRTFAEGADIARRVTPHMLRHTAATQLLEAGLDIRFLQKLLGHASITTTELYTHVANHALRAEVTRVNVRKRIENHR